LFRELYRHNARARRRYLREIWRLPAKERYRDRGATYPTLVDIYLHILDDYRFWFLLAYKGQAFRDYPLGTRLSRAEAERATREVERLAANVLSRLRPVDLGRKIAHPVDKKSLSVRSMLLNLLQGDLQHQGELNALLWQMDMRAPWLDYA
jgi:uncharacterized damage-inducible protein DinB